MNEGPPADVQAAFLISRLGQRQSTEFSAQLEPFGLRPKQFAILNIVSLAQRPSQQEVGAAMGLDPSGLIATIDELEERGLLARSRDPEDRRRYALDLTPEGRKLLTKARAASRKQAQKLLAPLKPSELEALLVLLRRLAA